MSDAENTPAENTPESVLNAMKAAGAIVETTNEKKCCGGGGETCEEGQSTSPVADQIAKICEGTGDPETCTKPTDECCKKTSADDCAGTGDPETCEEEVCCKKENNTGSTSEETITDVSQCPEGVPVSECCPHLEEDKKDS